LRVIGVRLDLHDGRLDSGGIDDPTSALDVDIGQADRARKPFIDKGFHRGPRFLQRDSSVVDDGAVRVPRILVVAGLERERGMHEIQIDDV